MELQAFFKFYPKVAIAFSGGVDSAFLFYAAKKYAEDAKAYYVKSEFQPAFEQRDAERLALELGGEMKILPLKVLEVPCGGKKCNSEDRKWGIFRDAFCTAETRNPDEGKSDAFQGVFCADKRLDPTESKSDMYQNAFGTDEFPDPETGKTGVFQDVLRIGDNPPDRCYYCKRAIFTAIMEAAAEDGYTVLLDGTNASDDVNDRPGMRALKELSVLSPLRQCGLTKAQVRQLSREAGLFTWNKPAYACLATRIPTGEAITEEKLHATETAEEELFSLGFTDFRVRCRDGHALLQVPEGQLGLVLQNRKEILEKLKPYYKTVSLDMETRSEMAGPPIGTDVCGCRPEKPVPRAGR